MHFRFLFFVLISFSILFVSCEADINLQNISDEVSLHPDLIFPIGGASVNLGQIITHNDSLGRFEIGEDAEINYVSFDSSEFKIPKIDILRNSLELKTDFYPSPYNVTNLPPFTNLTALKSVDSVRLGTNLNLNGDRIDSVRVNSATLNVIINISSDLVSIQPSGMKFTLVFPDGKIRMLDGRSASISFTPLSFGTVQNIVISNFMMSTAGARNGIPVEININTKSGNMPLLLTPGSVITSKISFSQLDYSVVFGNFKSGFKLPNSLLQNIDFDKDLPNGLLKFANPQVCISATSNVGSYLNFKIEEIKAFVSTNKAIKPVFADFNGKISTNVEFNRKPIIPGDTINYKLKTIDKDWGGTNQLFENESQENLIPDMLQYNFSATTDFDLNNQSKSPCFITSDAGIKVKIKTIIPLNFTRGSYYEFQDSLPNVFSLISGALAQFSYNSITSATFIMNIINGLPVKTSFSFSLIDSVGNILPTIFEKTYLIEAGKTDANGVVLPGKETKQMVQVVLNKDQLVILRKARILVYKVRVEGNTIDSNIHFTKTNTIDLKAGLFIKGDVNTSLGLKTKK